MIEIKITKTNIQEKVTLCKDLYVNWNVSNKIIIKNLIQGETK